MNVFDIIKDSWDKDTCYPSLKEIWTKENCALGQCDITSLAVNDLYGGKIMRCIVGDASHYYNFIDNMIIDLAASQFKNISVDNTSGSERSREYLLANEDTKSRYYKLLKKVQENLCKHNFEIINGDERINKKYLHSIANFSTFEIDDYYDCDEYEKVVFDLAAQNTGNIYSYKYYKESRKYEMDEIPVLFSMISSDYKMPKYILDQIFKVARNNKENLLIEQKICQKIKFTNK